MPTTETDLIAPVEETQKSSSPSVLLSSAAFVGSLVEGACAILVASASAKLFIGIGAVAAAVKASRLHADIVRIPVLLVSAAARLSCSWFCGIPGVRETGLPLAGERSH